MYLPMVDCIDVLIRHKSPSVIPSCTQERNFGMEHEVSENYGLERDLVSEEAGLTPSRQTRYIICSHNDFILICMGYSLNPYREGI